jgi:hypothetical protein
MDFKYTNKISWHIKPVNFQYAFLNYSGPQNEYLVRISDTIPDWSRLASIKFVVFIVVITFGRN